MLFRSLYKSAVVKSRAWEYECEYRLFAKTNFCEPREIQKPNQLATTEHFLSFEPEWVQTIDFGALCNDAEIKRIVEFVNANHPKKVICRKAKFHGTEYALDYQEI